jgi:hypothetical protein
MEQPNFSYLNSFSGGDQVFEKKILDIIKMEYPNERDTYLDNIAVNNFGLAANNVHKLRHKISLLGLEKSHVLASQHELNLIKGNNTLHENFNDILNTMARFLNEI